MITTVTQEVGNATWAFAPSLGLDWKGYLRLCIPSVVLSDTLSEPSETQSGQPNAMQCFAETQTQMQGDCTPEEGRGGQRIW